MTTATTTPPTAQVMADRIVRRNEVLKMLGIGRTTLADWQNPNSKRYRADFPQKIPLGTNAVGYLESEINAFLQRLADNRQAHA